MVLDDGVKVVVVSGDSGRAVVVFSEILVYFLVDLKFLMKC